MRRTAFLLLALGLLFAVPAASAHTTVATPDGKYLVTVGNLGEPVTTHTKTGLDLIIAANQTGRPGITQAHLTLQATLIAPNGEELSMTLQPQFGRTGAYTFEEPYYLTLAGEYFLRVNGTINGTAVQFARILVGSGPIPPIEELGFPDEVQSAKQLQARTAALEAKVAALEAEKASQKPNGNAAGADPLALVLALAAVGLFVARRRAV